MLVGSENDELEEPKDGLNRAGLSSAVELGREDAAALVTEDVQERELKEEAEAAQEEEDQRTIALAKKASQIVISDDCMCLCSCGKVLCSARSLQPIKTS